MFSWDKTGDRVAIVQLNAELRHAQLEMLSAQCATDRLRLRFSVEDIARHGQRDLLQKALLSANALHSYYQSIDQQISRPDSSAGELLLNERRILEAIDQLIRYLQRQREGFQSVGQPLTEDHQKAVAPFFASSLLDKVRTVTLRGERVSNPSFFAAAHAKGLINLPDFSQMPALCFEDVLVFHEHMQLRPLFHALVHAVQFEVLGLQRYADLLVRGLMRTRSYVTVPLEAHAFSLEMKFATIPAQPFSVEEKVRLWANQGRYEY